MRTAWVIEPSQDPIARWTTDPFRYHWPQLLARHGLSTRFFRSRNLTDTERLLALARCDVIFLATNWRDSLDETRRMLQAFSRRSARPKLVYLDTSDPTSSPFFSLLPFVDLMVKKQLLQPLSRYREELEGGHILADYFARRHGFALGSWFFGSRLPQELEHKLVLGWNLGSARELARDLAKSHLKPAPGWRQRKVDVHYRVGLTAEGIEDWYSFHRKQFAGALESLRGTCNLIAAAGKAGRVPLSRFHAEMRSTRLAVSPFGWGEVTDRDFHIVNNLSLLIKPDMSHLITEPNIYIAGETYVPVRWDGADLADVCSDYLKRPEQAERMARSARHAYRGWFLEGGFLRRMDDVLRRLAILDEQPRPRTAPPQQPQAPADL